MSTGVSTYEGADYSRHGIYRPTQNSKMRTLGQPYGPVDTEQLIEKMYETVHPIDSATAGGTYSASTTFSIGVVEPSDHTDVVQWYLDGTAIPGATGLSFNPSGRALSAGSHTLSVKVEDTTAAVRDETFRSQYMTATRQWTLAVGAPPADNAPPTAHYNGGSVTAGNATYRFSVTYSDNVAVKVSTIDSSDVQVINRVNGYNQVAKLISIDHTTNGTPRTRRIRSPRRAERGTRRTTGLTRLSCDRRRCRTWPVISRPPRRSGTLHVSLPSTINLGGRVFVDHNGDGVQQSAPTRAWPG